MKLKGWLFSALVAGGVVFGMRGGCVNNAAPDEELADHFQELCDIASDNIETPKKGVTKLGRYMGRHLDDILNDFGATIVTIEKIQDDAKHDARARVARERMQKPWRSCQRDWERFADAVEQDPEAREIVDHAAERLSRTFDIIFSSKDGESVDLRTLPERILNRF